MSKPNLASDIMANVPKEQGSKPQVAVAYLQTGVTWEGVFTTETTIATVGPKAKVGLTVYLAADGGLELFFNGRKALIPAPNVKIASLK